MRSPRYCSSVLLAALSCSLACVVGPPDEFDPHSADTEPETPDTDDAQDAAPYDSVSILVVVDNSGSMADKQQALTEALQGLPASLDERGIDWRLAVTTTDSGNPQCSSIGSEYGNFVATSCRSRLNDFVIDGDQELDATDTCLATCPASWDAPQMEPSAVEGEPWMRARPWIERIDGRSNVPGSLSAADAIGCIVPQGIDGCGFEQPLESAHRAMERTLSTDDNEYGFVPRGALLVVLLATDEVDCSYNEAQGSAFESLGERTFWNDTERASSAICWNAGVACDGPDCWATDLDEGGTEVSAERAAGWATLHPVSRYVDQLRRFGDAQVMLIGGVQADGQVTYGRSGSRDFLREYGVGPGCDGSAGSAVPPVRIRELVDATAASGERALFSICEDDQRPAIDALVESIAARMTATAADG